MTEQEQPTTQTGDMPFLAHIEELRQRLIRIVASILIISIISYVFSEYLVDWLVKPAGTVYFREPAGAFMVRIKVSVFAGVLLSIPVIIYQLWKFVVPGLYAHEVHYLIPVTFFGTLLFLGGAAFCLLLVIPAAMRVLSGFGTENLKAWIDIKEYFSFIFWMCLAFGVVFELPVVAFYLGKLGIIDARKLARGRRFALLAILVVAAILTPTPDVFSQLMLAGPLYLFYEISIIIVRLTGKRKPVVEG